MEVEEVGRCSPSGCHGMLEEFWSLSVQKSGDDVLCGKWFAEGRGEGDQGGGPEDR